MDKKKSTGILTIIIIAILAYQFITGDENAELTTVAENIATAIDSTEELDASTAAPAESAAPETAAQENPSATLEEADGDFDYWVMALSWSPDYCATNDYEDEQQCSIGKQLDFVLHGLWPQYEDGWPSYCTEEPHDYDLESEYAGLFPNDNLFRHEWEKHGTCSGLTPTGYFEWSETLKESLVIPLEYDSPLEPFRADAASLQDAFVSFNPTFSENAFAVYCSGSGRFLKEIYVCYEKDGDPRECSSDVLRKAAKSCGQTDFLVRNTR